MADTMADRLTRQFAASRQADAEWRAANWTPERIAACDAMQAAYVAYVRAFGEAWPEEAHLLPCSTRGPMMPEFRAARAASVAYEAIAQASPR